MFKKFYLKVKLIKKEYTFEEYEKNNEAIFFRGILEGVILYLSVCWVSLAIPNMLYLVFFLGGMLSIVGTYFNISSETDRLTREYIYKAKKNWKEVDRRLLFPIINSLEAVIADPKGYVYSNRDMFRRDVLVDGEHVYYYIYISENRGIRQSLPVSSVIFDREYTGNSYLIKEKLCFEDERFQSIAGLYDAPLGNERIIIRSRFIQW
ncbi:hypothetical protein [Enterococcus rotai]|uniref:hypothetical protein n=1 Tax=Enterococcus rotai TaxID=118060 RepID=UPI0032B51DF4